MARTSNTTLPAHNSPQASKKLAAIRRAAPNLLNDFEQITTAEATNAMDISVYRTSVTTGGVGKNLTIGNGTGAIVGQRKLVTVDGFTASHTVILDAANILLIAGSQAANVVLTALGQYLLLEWTGAKWKIIYGTAGTMN